MHGSRWTRDEIALLAETYRFGGSPAELAAKLNRTSISVDAKARKLALIHPQASDRPDG
jgi:hypothetical protein